MGFKAFKNHIGSLASTVVADIAGNFMQQGQQKDAGKVSAQLLKKGPFDIPESPSQKLRENPLSFSSVQYPIDLGTNELGHYILFEAGFLRYQPQQDNMFVSSSRTSGPAGQSAQEKITSKIPVGSISNSAIAIYMPPNVKVGYNQSYDNDTETGLAGDVQEALTNAQSAENVSDAIISALEGVSGGVFRQAGQAVGEFVSMAGAGDPVRFTLKRFGTAINPRNEAYYNTPTQRTFSYTFDFWPRNEEEAIAVENIIMIFKYNSSPGLASGDGLFSVPNYFKISYMFNNGENPHLHKIGACFCTSVDVDYTPDGQMSTFASGQPVHTKMTVNFLEDRILTKTDIEAGA
mgnify:FL=1|tara:strand:+ start:159 stop:1202 length:1044 start_codon:yes stop_codon:yes gene_type:complete